MDILNTDLLKEEDKQIQIDGIIYLIPADIPNRLYLPLLKANKIEDPLEKIEESTKLLVKIFKLKNPDLNEEEFADKITSNVYTAIINFLFVGMSIEETKERIMEVKEATKDGKKKPDQVEI